MVAGCAQPQAAAPRVEPPPAEDSLVPGTIGVVVRYNGEPVSSPRQFYRLMVDSRPGSVAQLELRREGALHTFEVPVEQVDITPRA